MENKKRKTKTSSAVKNRYNNKVYAQLAVKLPKDLVSRFKEKCLSDDISQAQVIKEAITRFLESDERNI